MAKRKQQAYNPMSILLPYQVDWVTDPSRFRIGLQSRQSGKSTMVAADNVYRCISSPQSTCLLLSVGERQAKELLLKCKQWAESFKIATPEEYKEAVEYSDNASEINFLNGSRIIALPASPATVRGYTATSLVLDEFALVENDKELWQAVVPSITNEIAGKKNISIISTPTSLTTQFAKIWNATDGVWSKHRVTIEDAVRLGLKADVEQLRKIVDDPLIWNTEFMCEFCSDATSAFPQEWLEDCKIDSLVSPSGNLRYFGYDVGRSKDLSVLIIVSMKDGVFTVEHMETYRNMPYAQQMEAIERAITKWNPFAGYVDGTGIGSMLAEEVHTKHPKIKSFQFNASSKTSCYDRLRKTIQSNQLKIPQDFYEQLLSDLLNVKRIIGSNGKASYSALHTADGHSDATSALALAIESSHDMPACFAEPLSWLPQTTMGRISKKF